MSHRKLLRELLLSLFGKDDLRIFISDHCPEIEGSLRADLALRSYAHESVLAMERRGYIRDELFEALEAEFPLRAADIALVARSAAREGDLRNAFGARPAAGAPAPEHALELGRLRIGAEPIRLYKGASPGSHYAPDTTDARDVGFAGDDSLAVDLDAIRSQVVAYRWPSPLVSLSSSREIARMYAGPGGWVYEVVLEREPVGAVYDPFEVMIATRPSGLPLHHQLDQLPWALRPPDERGSERPPVIDDPSPDLLAMAFALRDRELVATRIDPSEVHALHDV